MKTTLPFLNSYFWRSIYGPILAFVFPGILLVILGNIFRIEYIFPGIIGLSVIIITNLLLPITLSELKNSSVFKFIGTTKIGRGKFLFGVILFFILITILALGILFILLLVFFSDKVSPGSTKNTYFEVIYSAKKTLLLHDILKEVSFDRSMLSGLKTLAGSAQFLFSISLHFIFSLLIGLMVVSISKNPQWTTSISIIIVLISMFLSGMVIPVDIIASSKELKVISKFIPYSYTTGNIIISSTSIEQSGIYLSAVVDSTSSISKGNLISGSAKTFLNPKNGTKDLQNWYLSLPCLLLGIT
ncbi:MAG: ABC transporter permease, partial [Mycoplasmataceae bacterium]|nr:ABC transporter permease [Mycoplasmataceae bacterium]